MRETAQAIADARPRVVAALAAHCRDLDLAEDTFAEAAAACLELAEPPQDVAAWLMTVARRKAVDAIRKRQVETRALNDPAMEPEMADIITFPDPIEDERLRLIFICCHPAIAIEARVALALKVICGLPVAEMARVFVTNEAAMFQRITRAKRKVRDAGIAFELPHRKAWPERLDTVLMTLELAYTVAYQDAGGDRDNGLAAEVARLAALLAELVPDDPEVLGLAALIYLALSRQPARVNAEGAMVPLSQQDPTLWDYTVIEQARSWLDDAASLGRPGPYQTMAAIQLTHARRGFDGETDWTAIVALYDMLLMMRPDAIVELNRAVAISKAHGPEQGVEALERIEASHLALSRPYHVARADMMARAGQAGEARAALAKALALDPPTAERRFLERRLRELEEQPACR